MKLSCADYTFPLLEHDRSLALISMLGLEAVDIGFMGGRSHVRPEEVAGDLERNAHRLAERLEGAGVGIADLFLIPWTDFETLAPNHPQEGERRRARELFERTLEFAGHLGAPGISMLPGIIWPGEDPESSFARSAEELSWRVELANGAGVRLSVEPHVGSLIEMPDQAERLSRAAAGLQLTLDPSHFVFRGIQQERWETLVPFTGHVHLRGARDRRVQATMAENTIDFSQLVSKLDDAGYRGYLTLEYVWTDWERCNECDNVSETVLLRDHLRAILGVEARRAGGMEAAS
jgi:sugar phosphate isomerase/epimerase